MTSEDPGRHDDADPVSVDGDDREAGAGTAAEEGAEGEARRAGASDGPAEAREGTDETGPGAGETPGHVDEVVVKEEELGPEEELERLRDRHLRLAAEFDNYRRRTRREILEAGEAARADLARRLLEIVDDLQRVADTPCDPETHKALHDGVGLIVRKLLKTLGDAGVEVIDPIGERFDPNYHEALLITPTDDEAEDEVVSQVLLTGYRLGDRLLRPAQVAVFRHGAEGSA